MITSKQHDRCPSIAGIDDELRSIVDRSIGREFSDLERNRIDELLDLQIGRMGL